MIQSLSLAATFGERATLPDTGMGQAQGESESNNERKKMTLKVPQVLKPLECLGMHFINESGNQLVADCMLCGKAMHFYANRETGQCDCKVCGFTGNVLSFMTRWSEQVFAETSEEQFEELSRNRGLPVGIFKHFGLGFDGDQWLIPSRSTTGVVHDLRRYRLGHKIMSTTGCKTQLIGLERLKNQTAAIWLAEGEWDALTLAHILLCTGAKTEVALGVPGAGTFKDEWLQYFRGRVVSVCFDNDKAGQDGAEKVIAKLTGVAAQIWRLQWPL